MRGKAIQTILILIVTCLLLAPGPSHALANPAAPAALSPASCLIYAIHEATSSDSQFFTATLDPAHTIATLGGIYTDADLKGLDIHPFNQKIYASSSYLNTHGQAGYIFQVDGLSGALYPSVFTGYKKVTDLSFRPTDGSLWAWANTKGLLHINLASGLTNLVYASELNVGGIAWNRNGTKIFMAIENSIFAFWPNAQTLDFIDDNLPKGNIQSMEMRPDGLLAIAVAGRPNIYAYSLASHRLVRPQFVTTPYTDIEAIAWPNNCP